MISPGREILSPKIKDKIQRGPGIKTFTTDGIVKNAEKISEEP